MSEPVVGDSRRSQGRTITEADFMTWSGLVHDFTTLHVDAETAKTLTFGERIAHGNIALNLSVGLFFPSDAHWLTAGGTLRSTGWSNLRFTAPVKIGDTLTCTRTVAQVDDANGARVVVHDVRVTNQRDDAVMSGRETLRAD